MLRTIALAAAFLSFSGTAAANDDIDLELDIDITVETDDAVVIENPESSDGEEKNEEPAEPAREILEVDEDMIIGADFLGLPTVQEAPKSGLEAAVDVASVPTAESAQQLKWDFAMDEDGDLDLSSPKAEDAQPEEPVDALPAQDALLDILEE